VPLNRLSPLAGKIAEPSKAVIEEEVNFIGRAMTMFFDQYLGAAMDPLHFFHPFAVFRAAGLRFP
jgi:hypothetical protein